MGLEPGRRSHCHKKSFRPNLYNIYVAARREPPPPLGPSWIVPLTLREGESRRNRAATEVDSEPALGPTRLGERARERPKIFAKTEPRQIFISLEKHPQDIDIPVAARHGFEP